MQAQDKLRRALDVFTVYGIFDVLFDTDKLVLTINNIPFLPSETHALNILYRDDVGYRNFMHHVSNTEAGKQASLYLTPIFDLRSSLYTRKNDTAFDEPAVEPYELNVQEENELVSDLTYTTSDEEVRAALVDKVTALIADALRGV